MSTPPLWSPTPDYLEGSHLQALIEGLGLPDYDALYRFSLEQPEAFFEAAFNHLGFEWTQPYDRVLQQPCDPRWPRWFPGGRLNLAHNAVSRHLPYRADNLAVVAETEDGPQQTLTYAQLEAQLHQATAALQALGVQPGDRVGLFLPMMAETVVALLAVARLGAVAVPVFSGYAADAVATRLADAGACLLVTAAGFTRRGRWIDLLQLARQAVSLLTQPVQLWVVERGREVPLQEGEQSWQTLLASQRVQSEARPMDAMDPFMLIYTSGTTGKPKGTVHYHGGFPFKATQDLAHLFDLRAGETLFWFTDLGWMMGPWAILGALTLGATVVLYDGAPDFPHAGRLWELVERHRVTHLGISPTLVRSLAALGNQPLEGRNLSSLRILGSTGEPWNLEPYLWFFHQVGGGRLPIINYSGGTEIGGGILGCVTHRPIKPMGFNTAVPGMAATVLDAQGQPVVGQVGELAILAPWPGQTLGFWQAPERYLEAYWNRFEGVWVHGDWAEVDAQGHWTIQGRSDDTLKVAGKRVGPAEYESAAVEHPAVREAAAIGVPHPVKGEGVVLFVVLNPGYEAGAETAGEVVNQVIQRLGKALKPETLFFVPDLPKTRNAKVMRRVLRATHLGLPAGDLSALENPQALEAIPRADA